MKEMQTSCTAKISRLSLRLDMLSKPAAVPFSQLVKALGCIQQISLVPKNMMPTRCPLIGRPFNFLAVAAGDMTCDCKRLDHLYMRNSDKNADLNS